ncbi:hypothetical protein Salat_1749500 [Sesamum alatum]|uniref:Uncharacterized protein n=1 Tax=Sesamum alatum TaxID=300844 RepID=A0AAE2CKJ4_9LAMI|nr:hypothetical protein Salat_1749500 [Sesamum alatum]
MADIAESIKKHSEQDNLAEGTVNGTLGETRCNQGHHFEINASSSGIMGLAVPLRSEPLACSLLHLQAREESDIEVTSASGDVNNNKTRTPVSISGCRFLKLESSAEYDSVPSL